MTKNTIIAVSRVVKGSLVYLIRATLMINGVKKVVYVFVTKGGSIIGLFITNTAKLGVFLSSIVSNLSAMGLD